MITFVPRVVALIVWLVLATGLHGQNRLPETRSLGTFGNQDVIGVGEESPDGHFILYNVGTAPAGEPGRLRVFDARTGATHSLGVDGVEGRWSPAGDRVAFTVYSRDGTALHIWTMPVDPATGRAAGPARRASLRMGRGSSWSPDGRMLAFAALPPTDTVAPRVVVIPAQGGRERILVRATGWAHAVHWAPGGEAVFYRYVRKLSTPPRLLTRASLDGGEPTHLKPFRDLIGFSDDGRFMAYHPVLDDDDESGPVIQIATAEGLDLVAIPIPSGIGGLRWRPDGYRMHGRSRPLDFSVHSLNLRTGEQDVLSDSAGGWGVRFAPDGRSIAWISADDASLIVARPDGTGKEVLISEPEGMRALRWSPDGRHIAYLSLDRTELRLVPWSGGRSRTLATALRLRTPRWMDGGHAIQYVTETEDGSPRFIRSVDLTGGETLLAELPPKIGPRSIVQIVDDSLVVARDGSEILAVPLDGTPSTVLYTAPAGELINDWFAMSPDGQWIAVSTFAQEPGVWEPTIALVPRRGGAARRLELPGIADAEGVRWHPDGRHLVVPAYADAERHGLEFFLVPLSGGLPRSLSIRDAPPSDGAGFSISPDGSRVAFTVAVSDQVTLWELDLGPILEPFVREGGSR